MVIQTQSSVYFALLVRRGELLINFGNQKIYSNIPSQKMSFQPHYLSIKHSPAVRFSLCIHVLFDCKFKFFGLWLICSENHAIRRQLCSVVFLNARKRLK